MRYRIVKGGELQFFLVFKCVFQVRNLAPIHRGWRVASRAQAQGRVAVLQEVFAAQAPAHAPLPRVQQVRAAHGPPLRVGGARSLYAHASPRLLDWCRRGAYLEVNTRRVFHWLARVSIFTRTRTHTRTHRVTLRSKNTRNETRV